MKLLQYKGPWACSLKKTTDLSYHHAKQRWYEFRVNITGAELPRKVLTSHHRLLDCLLKHASLLMRGGRHTPNIELKFAMQTCPPWG